MTVAKLPKEPNEFGQRVIAAMKEEGHWTQNSLERAAGLGKGYLSRLIYGDRGGTSFNPQHMRALAKTLHVNFEWLVVGDGPMRRGGRATTTAEQAITAARALGCREDAIVAAWERNQDRASEMSAPDWTDAINTEAKRLDRAGVPRPEKAAEKREAILRTKKQLARETAKAAKERATASTLAEKAPARRLRA
jgi:transcriptional regulator with XRE-family HTH domain